MLSIIILTKNSEETIKKCIDSTKGLDGEIVVIDSESEDKTVEIAEEENVKVVKKKFIDFSDQRNYGMDKTSGDWVLYVDSDEELTENFKKELTEKILKNNGDSGYFIRRKTFYFGKDWGLTDKVQRVFLRSKFIEWHGTVHETPRIEGNFGIINSPIKHFTHQGLSNMVDKTNEWSNYEAELRFKSGHPRMTFLRFFRVILTGFFDSYFKGRGYKNGTKGMIESIYQAFSMFITYAKLWEKHQGVK